MHIPNVLMLVQHTDTHSPILDTSFTFPTIGRSQQLRTKYNKKITILDGNDEDITPSDVPADPPTVMQGPMTRARMRQLNLEVSSFLSDHFHTFETTT